MKKKILLKDISKSFRIILVQAYCEILSRTSAFAFASPDCFLCWSPTHLVTYPPDPLSLLTALLLVRSFPPGLWKLPLFGSFTLQTTIILNSFLSLTSVRRKFWQLLFQNRVGIQTSAFSPCNHSCTNYLSPGLT